jgi:hypothetical protein
LFAAVFDLYGREIVRVFPTVDDHFEGTMRAGLALRAEEARVALTARAVPDRWYNRMAVARSTCWWTLFGVVALSVLGLVVFW